ncbi:MAG: hypothetical protein KIT31_21780 [Deltaproteobacteria bacterium]|nr:hypothetical protein [Deltaproteobacteria bacterium]
MNRAHLALTIGALGSALLACGDNSKLCGPGTTDIDGICTGNSDPTVMCTDGTIKDPVSGNCVLDPNACQDGTVKVGNACVDPGVVSADIQEAAEPNGLGLLGEDSEDPAGIITLKPVGQHFVIKGTIAPFQDLDLDGQMDPDVDSYVIQVNQPAMLNITADGVHGLAAGFVAVAAVDSSDPLANWTRFGINLTGDTSKRQVYLPAAGIYVIAIADTRSLFLTGGAAGPAPGGLPFDYYVTIDLENATSTALTVDANGVAQSQGDLAPGETKLFTVSMGQGINSALYDVGAVQAVGAVVVANTSNGTTKVKSSATADAPDPASAVVLGLRAGDTQVVVADTLFNYAQQNINYALTIQTGSAGELSKTGQSVSQPSTLEDFSVFFYDVATNGEVTGMNLSWDIPVVGVVVDETVNANGNLNIFAFFTFDPDFGFFFGDTFTSYTGLLRHRTAGRYYFLVFDPNNPPAATITATSNYEPVSVTPVTSGTPLTAQAVNAFGTLPYSYDATAETWEAFRAAADGGTVTGTISGKYLPLDTSFGRLDPLVSTCTVVQAGVPTDFCADVFPLFSHTYAQAGTTVGRILLSDTVKKYLVTMRPTTRNPLPQIQVDFRLRDFTDLGTLQVGTPVTRTGEILSDTVLVKRYLLKTNANNGLSITLAPNAALNTRFQQLNVDETARGAAVNNGGVGAIDLAQLFQGVEGFTAFTATSVATLNAQQTYDLTAVASPATTYTRTAGATAFSDACIGGTVVTMQDRDEGFSTANIATPTGFNFFGFSTPAIKVNSNGFITTDTSLVCTTVGSSCFFTNATTMPSSAAPNGIIAPYWDDVVLAATNAVCQKTDGTKLIIQWRGTPFLSTTTMEFQAILDGSNSTIEFVYGPAHQLTGQSGTVGIENQIGGAASFVGANTAGLVSPAASILFTPM